MGGARPLTSGGGYRTGPSFDAGRAPYRREVTFAAVKTPNGRSADAAQKMSTSKSETANRGSEVIERSTVAGTWRTAERTSFWRWPDGPISGGPVR